MKKLAILGASGHGKVIADAAILMGQWDQVVFYDDAFPSKTNVEIWEVVGDTQMLIADSNEIDQVVIGIGNNEIREKKYQEISQSNLSLATIIHPKAVVSPFAKIQAGTVVFAGAVVNAFANIGECAILNTNSVIEHDCKVENFVHISPGAILAGGVHVGEQTWIGSGTSIKELTKITSKVIIGAGAVVVQDIEAFGTYVGVPAKRLER